MAPKPETIARVRNTYGVLGILLDRVPTQKEVCKAAPATRATVSTVWEEIACDEAPAPRQQEAQRKCLSCGRMFLSDSVGNRICGRCKSLDSWRSSVSDYCTLQY